MTDHSRATFHAVYTALQREGARALHAFPPDVIFGRFPPQLDESSFNGLPVRIMRAPDAAMQADLDPVTYRVIVDLFDQERILLAYESPRDAAFEDMVLEVPADGPVPSTGRERRVGAPGEIRERNIWQNSEFLIGTVLINMVFPESIGNGENWTMDEISGAISGIAIGLSEFQQRTHWVELNFYYNYEDFIMVPVSVEPIETYWTEHYLWVAELMGNLGYVSDDTILVDSGAVHKLNNKTREEYGTDWVFTVIIADQSDHHNPTPPSPDPDCWDGSGVIAYSFYGGPYIMVSYPACKLGYGMGFNRVFIHEMGHVFWAVDEYPSAGQHCLVTSGYLDVPNRNTLFAQCQDVVPCIMMGVFYTPELPVCWYTMGQTGLADENENSIPDIYETQPEIELIDVPGVNPDTIYSDEYLLGARIVIPAIPNRNFRQLALCPDEMIDYAARIVDGWYWINSQFETKLIPADGEWDESREDVGHIISGFEPGLNALTVRVESCVDLSGYIRKEVYRVGLKYYSAVVRTTETCMEISWVTANETFGAVFEIEKQDMSAGTAPIILATVTAPSETGAKKKSFLLRDESVVPAHRYRYRIAGKFDLEVGGESKHFEYPTADLFQTAMIPLGSDFVSCILPNPTREYVNFTVDVPKSFFDPSDSKVAGDGNLNAVQGIREEKTPVDIRVFNVNGRLVKTLYARESFGGIKTMRWDCVDDRGRCISPGVYFVRVKAGEKQSVRKVVVLR
ncbi:MAG TPA: T9SS type A sorting domain-containing protein [Patescibacteria group bacterium]|nr:T9SS type A sorting domain-containing protein [Patescibacteria group bacterium]